MATPTWHSLGACWASPLLSLCKEECGHLDRLPLLNAEGLFSLQTFGAFREELIFVFFLFSVGAFSSDFGPFLICVLR